MAKQHDEKTPLIRIAKKDPMASGKMWAIRGLSLVAALMLGSIIFLIAGVNPISAYGVIISKTLGKLSGIKFVVRTMVPLLGTGLALAPCFKMKYWNIGGEGQITMGAIGAAWMAFSFGDKMPKAAMLLLMAVVGVVFGAIWSMIPALFKARWNTNETLFTLMMNYIAIGIAAWLVGGPWEGKPGSQIAPQFAKSAVLPSVFGIHCGWIVILVLVFVMFVYIKYTKHGYEIAVLGESENTARYAGMNVTKIIIRTALLSGGICGLVGFMIASGSSQTLYADCAGGVGFTAITVAWLSQLNPFIMIGISAILAILSRGGSALATYMSVPVAISEILSGLILLCMLASEFFIRYKVILRGHHEKEDK